MPKRISILGYGWLGRALAKVLLSKAYYVDGSTTSKEKISNIKASGVVPYFLQLDNHKLTGPIDSFLAKADVLVVAFPPGLRHDEHANYSARIRLLLDAAKEYPKTKVLLLSSIGVFGQTQGIVRENSTPKPDSKVGEQLMSAEKQVLGLGAQMNIVRLGGLVGDGRHPAKKLSGRKKIPHPNAPTNLVHQKDVVRFLCAIIEQNIWGHILHCVSPFQKKRKEFYIKQCALAGLPLPEFDETETKRNKKAEDTQSKQLFNFEYKLVSCSIQDC